MMSLDAVIQSALSLPAAVRLSVRVTSQTCLGTSTCHPWDGRLPAPCQTPQASYLADLLHPKAVAPFTLNLPSINPSLKAVAL